MANKQGKYVSKEKGTKWIHLLKSKPGIVHGMTFCCWFSFVIRRISLSSYIFLPIQRQTLPNSSLLCWGLFHFFRMLGNRERWKVSARSPGRREIKANGERQKDLFALPIVPHATSRSSSEHPLIREPLRRRRESKFQFEWSRNSEQIATPWICYCRLPFNNLFALYLYILPFLPLLC